MQSAITAIEKAFGKGAIMHLGDNHGMAVERIPPDDGLPFHRW
ncbi:DNA recombination/repair protein RecA [Serratia marcescens]|nr:DNA recombination/repair protein RecA [Serratia marcescens]MCW6025675.1 DNA recombination/repair protein RecA [Serratia marcescens]